MSIRWTCIYTHLTIFIYNFSCIHVIHILFFQNLSYRHESYCTHILHRYPCLRLTGMLLMNPNLDVSIGVVYCFQKKHVVLVHFFFMQYLSSKKYGYTAEDAVSKLDHAKNHVRYMSKKIKKKYRIICVSKFFIGCYWQKQLNSLKNWK